MSESKVVNILVGGIGATGKTTLINCLTNQFPSSKGTDWIYVSTSKGPIDVHLKCTNDIKGKNTELRSTRRSSSSSSSMMTDINGAIILCDSTNPDFASLKDDINEAKKLFEAKQPIVVCFNKVDSKETQGFKVIQTEEWKNIQISDPKIEVCMTSYKNNRNCDKPLLFLLRNLIDPELTILENEKKG